ncbi:MAG: hypothetical protein P1P64_00875 [Treponemataceae bacterium]
MANEVLLTVTEEERRIAREISENNYQRMLKFESEIAREKGYSKGRAQGRPKDRPMVMHRDTLKVYLKDMKKAKRVVYKKG